MDTRSDTPPQPDPQQPEASKPKEKGNTALGCGCLSVVVLIVIAIAVAAFHGSGGGASSASSASTPTAATSSPPTDGGSYSSAADLLAALASAGLPCTSPSQVANPSATGTTSMTGCDSPGDTGSLSDTVAVVFDSHADAEAYAQNMLGLATAGAEVVVGENWALNTEAPYGDQAAGALGGTVTDSTAAPTTAAPPSPTVVLTESGNGIESTQSFTVDDEWALQYTFDCSNFGMQGNFQVFEDYPNGDTLVNSLADNGSDTTYQTGDAGTHTLKVNSECDWTIKVINDDDGQ